MNLLYAAAVVAYAYIVMKAIPTFWLWLRARYLTRHLPRDPEEMTTLLGCPPKMMGPHRHLSYIGSAFAPDPRTVAFGRSLWLCIDIRYFHGADTAKLGAVTFGRMLWIQVTWHEEMPAKSVYT